MSLAILGFSFAVNLTALFQGKTAMLGRRFSWKFFDERLQSSLATENVDRYNLHRQLMLIDCVSSSLFISIVLLNEKQAER
jgi:hypothetical protein